MMKIQNGPMMANTKMMKKMKGGGMANMMRGLGGMQSKMGPGGMPGMPPGGKFPRF